MLGAVMSLAIQESLKKNEDAHAYNPMQTDGFEFVEFATPENDESLDKTFKSLGFSCIGKHRSKNVFLYRQGDINFILNKQPRSFASDFVAAHGSSVCAMAIRVKDSELALNRAVSLGARPYKIEVNKDELAIPAIYGVGDSLIYFVDRYDSKTIYDYDFELFSGADLHPTGHGLGIIDHLTNNVYQGQMSKWASFYEKIFNFREIRYFHITGQKTGLLSKAMTSPCGKIRIPINEPTEESSQIAEYLRDYKGEGIQHIALTTKDIVKSVSKIRQDGINFLDISETYYEVIRDRFPTLELNYEEFSKYKILIDGEIDGNRKEMLYQIFTENIIGPVFFELIQREGHDGFGEGNFSALFESLERDQERRGVL
jgi:4-hydroxyphenylpyruvate dioxygenase